MLESIEENVHNFHFIKPKMTTFPCIKFSNRVEAVFLSLSIDPAVADSTLTHNYHLFSFYFYLFPCLYAFFAVSFVINFTLPLITRIIDEQVSPPIKGNSLIR